MANTVALNSMSAACGTGVGACPVTAMTRPMPTTAAPPTLLNFLNISTPR